MIDMHTNRENCTWFIKLFIADDFEWHLEDISAIENLSTLANVMTNTTYFIYRVNSCTKLKSCVSAGSFTVMLNPNW